MNAWANGMPTATYPKLLRDRNHFDAYVSKLRHFGIIEHVKDLYLFVRPT